jgi:hypothetical protein
MQFFRFNKSYFVLTVLLFIIEVLIAAFVYDNFIRPYVGDYLVVILMYSFGMSFISVAPWKMILATLVFSYAIETFQYFNLVGILGLQHSRIANIVIGNSFSWNDIIAYTLGALTLLGTEQFLHKRK